MKPDSDVSDPESVHANGMDAAGSERIMNVEIA